MASRVVIVGVGALGSHVAQFLRNEAVLKVIDFDRVEQKNILAQFFSKPSIGKNKAVSIKDMFAFLYSINVGAVAHRLTKDNVEQLLSDSDLIIDCVDNAETRHLIQQYVRAVPMALVGNVKDGIFHGHEVKARCRPCLHGAVSANGDFGQVCWDQHFTPDHETAGAATCEGGEHLPFIVTVAAILAKTAQQFLKTGQQRSYSVLPDGRAIQTT